MDAVDEERLGRRTPVRRHWVKLAGCVEPAGLARRRVRDALAGRASPDRIDDAVLVASELVGNALRHTVAGPDCMCVEIYRHAAVLRVHDAGRDVSRVRVCSVDTSADRLAEGGLGLLFVRELASGWAVRPTAIGKEVVAVLALGGDELTEREVLLYIPAVRASLTADLHQLDGPHGEFDIRKSTEP
ncbi:ATP-binding protein [Streptomyces sp. NPDC046942]|uniref:ATP-binding protein n=1 Tax=Streptomyces sp. NPDC046942 TaxID=3155137 RepID=UPI0034107CB6